MKLRTEQTALTDAVAWASKATPNRPSVPVLAAVKLAATDGALTVAGFDYEMSAEARITADVATDGTVLVSGRLLADITKALPNRPVDLTENGATLELVCGSGRYTLPTMPSEDYPLLPDMPTTAGTIDTNLFATTVTQVATAAGRDGTLPMMTGIRLEMRGDRLTLMATDRYRLALRDIDWNPDQPDTQADALIPAHTLADAVKQLPKTGDITLAYAHDNIGAGVFGIRAPGRTLTTRLLDGEKYPPVRTLFPAAFNHHATVDTPALVEVVRRVALVAERTTPVLLTFSPDGLVVEAGGTEEARANEALDAEHIGDELTVGFNPQYLVDGLQAFGGKTALLSFVDAFKPAVITPAPDDGSTVDPHHRYLIMPIRVTR